MVIEVSPEPFGPLASLHVGRGRLDVHVTGGFVRGVQDGDVLAWRGMPYAAPPVGALRFRVPHPVPPWPGIRDASRFGNVAPQVYKGQFRGTAPRTPSSEDCLTMNVQCPLVPRRKRLAMPVMVFIHGGGYSTGGSLDYSGQGTGFVRSGRVIYVSFNYRLGALGYLDFSRYSTADRPFDSNLGLRDQVAALEWVRDNIRSFGGNPHNVTIFGESAGANSVLTLMTTPTARGLFARAIAQSPPADAAYPPEQTAAWAGEFVAELRAVLRAPKVPTGPGHRALDVLNVVRNAVPRSAATPSLTGVPVPVPSGHFSPEAGHDDDAQDRAGGWDWPTAPIDGAFAPGLLAGLTPAELLATASAADLTLAALALQVRTPDSTPGTFCLAPVVDGDFLPERPLEAFRAGRAQRVPLIIGTNDREGSIFRGRADVLPRSPERIRALFQGAPEESREAMRAVYPWLPTTRAAADFGGDYAFWYPSMTVADRHSRHVRVHVYRFDNAPRLVHLLGLDATHGIEMYALFSLENTRVARTMTSLGGREPFTNAGERMRRHWLRFACTGKLEESWPAYDERNRLTLIIDDSDRVESDPRGDRRHAWQAFRPGL